MASIGDQWNAESPTSQGIRLISCETPGCSHDSQSLFWLCSESAMERLLRTAAGGGDVDLIMLELRTMALDPPEPDDEDE